MITFLVSAQAMAQCLLLVGSASDKQSYGPARMSAKERARI
jgi:hypothetical protein